MKVSGIQHHRGRPVGVRPYLNRWYLSAAINVGSRVLYNAGETIQQSQNLPPERPIGMLHLGKRWPQDGIQTPFAADGRAQMGDANGTALIFLAHA